MKLSAVLLLSFLILGPSFAVQRTRREGISLSADSTATFSQSNQEEETEVESPILGGVESQSTNSDEASSQLESRLQQLESKNLINKDQLESTGILSFSTQVAAGKLYNVLAEAALKNRTYEIVYIQLWDAPCEGVNDAMQGACTYASDGLIYGSLCIDASDCLKYVQTNGNCM